MYKISEALRFDIFLSSFILLCLIFLFHQTTLDEKIAGQFFSHSNAWIYRDNFFLEKVLHKDGVVLIIVTMFGLLGAYCSIVKKPEYGQLRNYLSFILISSLLTIIFVFLLKRWTTLPCPWNSKAFGGAEKSPDLWEMFSSKLPKGHCFPGGHSSGGYAFLSMYFGYTYIYGKRKFRLLIPGILIGVIFGLTQEIRGAHFVSHDLTTILVSVLSSWITALIYSCRTKSKILCWTLVQKLRR